MKAEPVRFHRAELFQPSINALETFAQDGSEEIPHPCRLVRAGLGHHLNADFQPERIGHRGAFSLALNHEPVTGRTTAKLRGRGTAAAHTEREIVAFYRVLNIDDADIPLPQMQRVADVEELFLPVQFEFMQSL